MIKNINWQQQKSPPIWIWFLACVISIAGIFLFGIHSEYLDLYWQYLAIYNAVIIIIAIFYLLRFFKSLRKNKKQNIAGSKFSISLAKIIPILTIIPVLSFYAFSFQSIQNNLELAKKSVEKLNTNVFNEAGEIYKDLRTYQAQTYIDKSTQLLKIVSNLIENKNLVDILNRLTINDICKISIFKDNKNIASSEKLFNCETWDNYKIHSVLYYIDNNTSADIILTQLPLKSILKTDKNIVLVVFYKKKIKLNMVVNRIVNFQKGIKNANITLNSSIIQRHFLIDFSTTILLTLLSILIIVLKMLEKIMIPLNELSIASKRISKGEYGNVINSKNNDISGLINEFNSMSLQIKLSKKDIDNKNIYLETVIKYSSGIIAMDKNYKICLHNDKVIKLLKIANINDKNIDFIANDNAKLQQIITDFKKFNTINVTIEIDGILLDIAGVKLRNSDKNIGYMLIIKDISNIRKTQKLQAWNEVARKMAHEIKNPLNPILLSAQRLRNKYLQDGQKNNQIIDKTTKTIISQVESISLMVSSFAEYGKTPTLNFEKYDLNKIIKDSTSLYNDEYNIQLKLGDIPKITLDKDSISRVLINLLKNSIEAKSANFKIIINTYKKDNNVILDIIDNGKGFDKAIIDKVFEPYVTSKKSGSGLGMAIIKKIITSHNGLISIDKKYQDGAKIIIQMKI